MIPVSDTMIRLLSPLLTRILFTASATATDDKPAFPIGFCLIPEMDFIPEVAGWASCKPHEYHDKIGRDARRIPWRSAGWF